MHLIRCVNIWYEEHEDEIIIPFFYKLKQTAVSGNDWLNKPPDVRTLSPAYKLWHSCLFAQAWTWICSISPPVTHHQPAVWEDPRGSYKHLQRPQNETTYLWQAIFFECWIEAYNNISFVMFNITGWCWGLFCSPCGVYAWRCHSILHLLAVVLTAVGLWKATRRVGKANINREMKGISKPNRGIQKWLGVQNSWSPRSNAWLLR